MATFNVTRIEKISIDDIAESYRGKTGCACGCGGIYFEIAEQQLDEITKHIKYVNKNIANATFFGNGVEVTNPSYTSATRLYFKEGVLMYRGGFANDNNFYAEKIEVQK